MRYFRLLLFIRSESNIFLTSQTFSWLLGSMSGISFIWGVSESTNFKTKMWQIYIILILFRRSNLYVTNPRTFAILKSSSFVKFSLLLSLVVWINIIFVFGVLCRRYTLFLFLRVGPWTFFLVANFFISWTKLNPTKVYFVIYGFLPLIFLHAVPISYIFVFLVTRLL